MTCVSDPSVESPAAPDLFHYQRKPPPARIAPRVGLPNTPGLSEPDWLPSGRRISKRWRYIVIHHSATRTGGAAKFDKHHRERNGWDELGYHFVIGNGTSTPDGMVEVGPRWRKQKHGAHCKTRDNYYNEHGVGICLVGDFTRSRPTADQLASLERLVRFLCERCNIAPSNVTTHRAVTGKTRCPGRFFALARLRRSIAARLSAVAGPSSLPSFLP